MAKLNEEIAEREWDIHNNEKLKNLPQHPPQVGAKPEESVDGHRTVLADKMRARKSLEVDITQRQRTIERAEQRYRQMCSDPESPLPPIVPVPIGEPVERPVFRLREVDAGKTCAATVAVVIVVVVTIDVLFPPAAVRHVFGIP